MNVTVTYARTDSHDIRLSLRRKDRVLLSHIQFHLSLSPSKFLFFIFSLAAAGVVSPENSTVSDKWSESELGFRSLSKVRILNFFPELFISMEFLLSYAFFGALNFGLGLLCKYNSIFFS